MLSHLLDVVRRNYNDIQSNLVRKKYLHASRLRTSSRHSLFDQSNLGEFRQLTSQFHLIVITQAWESFITQSKLRKRSGNITVAVG